jgi:transposase
MIDFQTYMQIRHLADQGLKGAQIARTLELDERTVVHWIEQKTYQPAKRVKKASKLDPYKGQIVRMLESHPYSAQQIFQRLAQEGYGGSYGIVKEFVRQVRPAPRPAFLSLYFEPGQCAQVDWGHAGLIQVGSAKRHLSFFVMVLAYSRRMYVEFTLSQSQEHWLACHLHAWSYFNGVSAQVMVDNCKTAVLSHALGQTPVLNPRYLDFAQHYGFQIKACGPKKPHEKGRVEAPDPAYPPWDQLPRPQPENRIVGNDLEISTSGDRRDYSSTAAVFFERGVHHDGQPLVG